MMRVLLAGLLVALAAGSHTLAAHWLAVVIVLLLSLVVLVL